MDKPSKKPSAETTKRKKDVSRLRATIFTLLLGGLAGYIVAKSDSYILYGIRKAISGISSNADDDEWGNDPLWKRMMNKEIP